MDKEIYRRVEVIAPVEDASLKEKLKNILCVYLADNVKARRFMPEGSYERVKVSPGVKRINRQTHFIGS